MVKRTIHTIFFYLLVVISFFVGTAITVIAALFCKDKTKVFQVAAQRWARLLVAPSGIKVSCIGSGNIPANKGVIFAANHQGAADILLALAYLPVGLRFAIKRELFSIPFFGWYIRQAGHFSVDRKKFRSAYETVEEIVKILKADGSVLIFPEGTRTLTGELGRFKRGSLLAALKSGAPIVPVAISGSFNILPSQSWLINRCPVKISIGRPVEIKTEEDYETKVEEIRQTIAGML